MRTTRVMAMGALALLAGCGLNSRASQDIENPVYVLETVDGAALPHFQGAGSAVAPAELFEGMLQLRKDGTFYIDFTWRTSSPVGRRFASRSYQGTWQRFGESIRFEFDNGAVSTAEALALGVEVEIDGTLYRFAR